VAQPAHRVCALATIGIVTYVGWHIGPLASVSASRRDPAGAAC
jgi:hypothetical protein